MMQLRPYQAAAEKAFFDYWAKGGGHGLAEMATGTGKSALVASKAMRLRQDYPDFRSVILCPSKELVAQNFSAMLKIWPGAPAGICCAGLGRRDTRHPITFATVQSVFRNPKALGERHHIQIDEAHLLPPGGDGMFHSLIDGLQSIVPDLRVSGYTASPYRMDMGRLDSGHGKLFNDTVFSYGIAEGIADGWLAPLVSKASLTKIDDSSVQKRGGEFAIGSLGTAADAITEQAVSELMDFGQARRAWILFCAGVKHATNVAEAVKRRGISCEVIHGDMPAGQRDSIIRRYRSGEIRCLSNADLLTTGFDVPFIDLIGLLRPTLSVSLFVQMCGRGTRPVWPSGFNPDNATSDERVAAIAASQKPNCLVLDWANNIRRHGPVDAVSVLPKNGGCDDSGKVGVDSIRAKECPECQSMAALNASECKVCGHEWPRDEKPHHEAQAEAQVGILSSEQVPPQMVPVVDWRFDRHQKIGAPDSVRVTYMAGLSEFREWLAFEHGGYATQKACQWWTNHGGDTPFPKSTGEAIDRSDELIMPATISVKPRGKYYDIVARTFGRKQKGEAA